MCILTDEKTKLFFAEYKEGFEELQQLVSTFEGVNDSSRLIFLDARENLLKQQKSSIDDLNEEVVARAKKMLAAINSELFVMAETQNFIEQQLEECRRLRQVMNSQSEQEMVAP